MPAIATEKFERVEVATSRELREWLLKNHKQKESVWLVTYKKAVPEKYLSTGDVLDELLCFGWIDGIRRKLDDHRTMQLISPRRATHWSKTYKERAARLIQLGKMHSSGLQSIRQAKKTGAWHVLDQVDQLTIPDDLKKALTRYKGATAFFESINASSKRFALRWIELAKTSATRASRVEHIARLASQNEKLKGS